MGDLFCLDALTVKKIWYRHLQQDFSGRRPEWGYAGSPTVEGRLLFLDSGGKDGSTLALEKASGELVWKSGSDEAGYAPPLVATLEGKRTLLTFKAKALVALQPESGTELWRIPWKTSYDVNSATPLVFGNRVFLSSGYGTGCALFEIRNGTPFELWRNRHLRSHVSRFTSRDIFLESTDRPSPGLHWSVWTRKAGRWSGVKKGWADRSLWRETVWWSAPSGANCS